MLDLLKRKAQSPAAVAGIINKLDKRRSDALADFDRARAEHATAALAAEEDNEGAQQALLQARRTVAKFEERYLDINASLDAAKARHEAATAAETLQSLAKRWDAAEEAGAAYVAAVSAYQESVERLAADYRRVLETNAALAIALPVTSRPDLAAEAFRGENVISEARLALKYAGFPTPYTGDPTQVSSFKETQSRNTEALLALRPR